MILKDLNKSLLINISLIFSIFLLDRVSKIYVINLDKKLIGSEIFSSKFLNIYLVWNEGIAFGLFSSNDSNFYNIITFLIVLINILIIYILFKLNDVRKYFFLIILGGSLGNLFDRFVYNAVPDFIDFHIGDFHWFIFNAADIFISIGVFFVILSELFANKNKNDKKI